MAGGSTKAVLAALFANAGIAIAKFVAFLVTRSAAMLAESIHSVADSSNQALLLLGGRRARRAATEEHPFGYGRERYFWSFVVALVLFALGGVFSLFEGYDKLVHPHEITSPEWAIGVLVFGLVLETYSLRTAVVESNRVRGNRSWIEFIRHSKSPELPVVLLEDIGAELGLVAALVAVSLAAVTGNPVWDALGTLFIGVLLVIISIVLTIEMKSLLIGEAAGTADLRTIRERLAGTPGIAGLIHMRTQHLGPEELLVAAKVELSADVEPSDIGATIDEAERRVREAVPAARMIYLEPDTRAVQPSAAAGS